MDGLRVAKIDGVVLGRTTREPPHTKLKLTGTLHLTPHHLFFSPDPVQARDRPAAAATAAAGTDGTGGDRADSGEPEPDAAAAEEVWIPYPTIVRFQRLPASKEGYPLQVATKTFDSYTLWFARDREGGAEDVWQSVRDCAVVQSVEQLYAFFYTLPKAPAAVVKSAPAESPAAAASSPAASDNPLSPLSPLSVSPEKPTVVAPTAPADTEAEATGWGCYNVRAEFARQGLGTRTRAWRFTDINRDYAFCPTYPAKLVVPARISDSVLAYAAKYRSKGRVPALTYLHWANHASITRSSQPMVGLKNARSAQDERLVECIFTSHQSADSALSPSASASATPPRSGSPLSSPGLGAGPGAGAGSASPPVYGATAANLIIDARPTTNAMANVAKGAGTENMDWYRFAKKAYLGIDNIHVMRASLRSITDAIADADLAGTPVDRERLRRSGWLRHIGAILEGALLVVRNVHVRASHVLVHCSDGWDRTAQLSALAQLCLDPYFRTVRGFAVLVEKDWLSFGHMFCQRSGHLSSERLFAATPADLDGGADDDDDFGSAVKGAQAFFASVQKQFASNAHLKEVSPVFHQFLDCVRQLQRQFPAEFEFSEEFLLDLHYHLYACQFGTFLFDSERQRRAGVALADRTVSVWAWAGLPGQRERYVNAAYAPDERERVLFPDARDVVFWHRLWKRGDEEMNAPPPSERERERSDRDRSEQRDRDRARGPNVDVDGEPFLAPVETQTAPPPAREDSFSTLSSAGASFDASPRANPLASPPTSTQGWGWGHVVRSGALNAFQTFKASATDALQRLNDEPGSYATGTGIGEARAGGARGVRGPIEANPWDDGRSEPAGELGELGELAERSVHSEPAGELPGSALGALGASVGGSGSLRGGPATGLPRPARAASRDWANPWDDAGTRSLAELTLDTPAAGATGAAPARKTAATAPSDDEAAALGSGGWDPLGAA